MAVAYNVFPHHILFLTSQKNDDIKVAYFFLPGHATQSLRDVGKVAVPSSSQGSLIETAFL